MKSSYFVLTILFMSQMTFARALREVKPTRDGMEYKCEYPYVLQQFDVSSAAEDSFMVGSKEISCVEMEALDSWDIRIDIRGSTIHNGIRGTNLGLYRDLQQQLRCGHISFSLQSDGQKCVRTNSRSLRRYGDLQGVENLIYGIGRNQTFAIIEYRSELLRYLRRSTDDNYRQGVVRLLERLDQRENSLTCR